MKKRFLTLVFILSLATFVLAGCGSKDATADEQTAETETNTSLEDTVTDTDAGLNLFSSIGPVAEEDAVATLGGVDIKVMQTWEEFKALMDANGWTMDEDDYPSDDGYGGGFVSTPYGQFDVGFTPNRDKTGYEVDMLSFSFNETKAEDLNIHGITMKTTPDQLKEVLEYLPDSSGDGYDSFKLDTYLKVQLMNTLDDPQEYHLTISRTAYFKRTE